MRRFSFRALALAIVTLATAAHAAYDVVSVPVTDFFVPVGFDDNDRVEIVLDGYLPDTCHKLDDVSVQVDEEARTITVDQKAKRILGACADVTVPFVNTVNLGTVAVGAYRVTLAQEAAPAQPLEIKKAPVESADDFLYAPVDSVSVEKRDGSIFARIEGRFTSSCLSLERVDVTHTGKTIQVLPIMKYDTSSDEGCELTERPFKEYVLLPAVEPTRHLLHVRSLEGQSKNLVFNPARISR